MISHCISDEGKGRKLSQREFFKVKKDITLSDEGAEAIFFLAKQRFLSLPQKNPEGELKTALTHSRVCTHIQAHTCLRLSHQ